MILSLMLSVAACGNETETAQNDTTAESTDNKDTDEKTGGTESQASDLPETYVSEEPLELTLHMHFRNAYAYNDEWPVFKEAERLTNVS